MPGEPLSAGGQATMQMAGISLTLGFSIISGLVTGTYNHRPTLIDSYLNIVVGIAQHDSFFTLIDILLKFMLHNILT